MQSNINKYLRDSLFGINLLQLAIEDLIIEERICLLCIVSAFAFMEKKKCKRHRIEREKWRYDTGR